jgi:hypothetical protein
VALLTVDLGWPAGFVGGGRVACGDDNTPQLAKASSATISMARDNICFII